MLLVLAVCHHVGRQFSLLCPLLKQVWLQALGLVRVLNHDELGRRVLLDRALTDKVGALSCIGLRRSVRRWHNYLS